jgi:hypothetical protein
MAAKKAAATAPVNKAAPKKKAAPKRKAALKKKAAPKQVVTKPAATSSKPAARKTPDYRNKYARWDKVISPSHVIFYRRESHYCSTDPPGPCQVAKCFSPDKAPMICF